MSVSLRLVPDVDDAGDDRHGDAVLAHEPVLTAVAIRLCRNRADALDLVQDTFERALRAWDRTPPGVNLEAWLVTILHRLFIDRCRRARRARAADVDAIAPARVDGAPAGAWDAVTPERLAHALATLDEDFRRPYVMHIVDGCSYQQIAERLAIPRNTVGTRLLRARRKLRVMLGVEEGS